MQGGEEEASAEMGMGMRRGGGMRLLLCVERIHLQDPPRMASAARFTSTFIL